MVNELQPQALRQVAEDLMSASQRLGGTLGSCPAPVPGVSPEVAAAIQAFSADEQTVAIQAADAFRNLATDLDQRVQLVRATDGAR